MDKPNVFRTSDFYMSEGDTLHVSIKDATGTTPFFKIIGEDGGAAAYVADENGAVVVLVGGDWHKVVEDLKYCHGSIYYDGHVFGSARNSAFGQLSGSGGYIYKVNNTDYSDTTLLNVKYASDSDTSSITHLEQIGRIGDVLYCIGTAQYLDPLDDYFPAPRNILLKINKTDLSWQIFRITEAYGYIPFAPIIVDSTHLYIATTTRIIKYLASDFDDVGFGQYNTETYGNTGVPVSPTATFTQTSYGATNKSLHSGIVDNDHLFLAFNDTSVTDASLLIQVLKSDMSFVDSAAIPITSDDMAATATHVFLGVETTVGKVGYEWAVVAIRKSDLTVTALRKYSDEESGISSYGVTFVTIGGVDYLADMRTDGRVHLIDITGVDTWDGSVNGDSSVVKTITFSYTDEETHPVVNEIVQDGSGDLHAFLWDDVTELMRFTVREI